MSAVDPDARKRLAAALPHTGRLGMLADDRLAVADALLPVVRAMVAEGAAKELRAAAGSAVRVQGSALRGRAHDLDGNW